METVIFAAGCFWGVQYHFDQLPGVVSTTAGYTGGHSDNPTYWDVASHLTGHAEAVEIIYDPKIITFRTLLKHFFLIHDPTQLNQQGPDIGDEYRSAIFYTTEDQKSAAEEIIAMHNKYKIDAKVVTEVVAARKFWPAESEHQKFSEKTGIGMCRPAYKPL